MNDDDISTLELTASIVSAYVAKNSVPIAGLPDLVSSVHASLQKLTEAQPVEPVQSAPAISIKKSITPDYLISLEDGKKFKSLKRHLSTHYGLSPDAYRAKWNLPSDYPMVAPNYAAKRSALARSMGLGRKAAVAKPEVKPAAPPAKRGRPKKV